MKWRENKAAISVSQGVYAGSSHYVIGLKMAYGHEAIVKGAQTVASGGWYIVLRYLGKDLSFSHFPYTECLNIDVNRQY